MNYKMWYSILSKKVINYTHIVDPIPIFKNPKNQENRTDQFEYKCSPVWF